MQYAVLAKIVLYNDLEKSTKFFIISAISTRQYL